MAETDYRVTYKSRVDPRDSDRSGRDYRSRAYDSYDNSYPARSVSRPRPGRHLDDNSTVGTESTVTATKTAKTTRSAKNRSREVDIDVEESKRDRGLRSSRSIVDSRDQSSRRTIVLDQNSPVTRSPRSSGTIPAERQRRNQDVIDIDVDRPRARRSDFVVDNTIRRDDGAYVMDTRGELDIIMPGRDRPQDTGRRDPRYVYKNASPARRRQFYDDYQAREGEAYSGGVVILRQDTRSPPRSRSRHRPNARRAARKNEEEEEEDDEWRLVESMRDTRVSSAPRESRARSRARSKAPTQSSEDSFVIVSPKETSPQPVLRSALRREGHAPRELHRRRSRSISFRDKEVANHDASECRHERPGAEAVICGQHLKKRQSENEVDVYDRRRASEVDTRDDRKKKQSDAVVNYTYEDRVWTPYAPQQDRPSRRRSRSRRRRKEEDDNESYYSEHKYYKKETRYV